jgi:hypothetical protein
MLGNVTVWAHEHPNLIALFVAAAGLGATILVLRTRNSGDTATATDPTTDVGTGLINSGGGADSNRSLIDAINQLLTKLNTTVTPPSPTPNPLPKPIGYVGPPIKGLPTTNAPSTVHGSVVASVKQHPTAQLIKPVQLGRYIDPNTTRRNVN